MSKKFSKLALFSALAGAAAAGTYYLLQNRPKRMDDFTDDLEDLDDIDEDLENEDFTSDPTAGSTSSRNRSSYVSIDLENAKEKIGEKVIETLDKTKEKIEQFNVSEKIDRAKEIVSEMTTPASEPVYTQVDMSATPDSDAPKQENTTDEVKSEPADNVAVESPSMSATYAEPAETGNSAEAFFDDTTKDTTES